MKVRAAGGVTTCVPETALVPLQSSLAWQAVALELDQVSFVDWPTVSAVGLALMLTITGSLAGAAVVVPVVALVAVVDEPPPPPQDASTRQAAAAASCMKPSWRGVEWLRFM